MYLFRLVLEFTANIMLLSEILLKKLEFNPNIYFNLIKDTD